MTTQARDQDHRAAPPRPGGSAIAAGYSWRPQSGRLGAAAPDGRGARGTLTLHAPASVTVRSAGVDLADARRFRTAVARTGQDIVRRIFTAAESAATSSDPELRLTELTALFGVKESVVKVLGGLPSGSRYRDIVVDPLTPGLLSPVHLRGVLADWADRHEVTLVSAAVPVTDHLALAWAAALTAQARR